MPLLNSRLLSRYGDLLRNATWLGAASLAVKPLWFLFITLLCARVLGAEGYGVLNTALSLCSLTFAVTNFGITQFTVREVAADRSLAPQFLSNFLLLRLGLILCAALLALSAALMLGYDVLLLLAVGIACVYQASLSMAGYARSFFQAFEVLKYQAVSIVVEKGMVVGGGILCLYSTTRPQWTLAGMAVGMTLAAAGTLSFVIRRLVPFKAATVSMQFWRRSSRVLWMFGIASLLGMVFFRIDTVMVEAMEGVVAAGQYGLPFRIVEALSMLPVIVVGEAAYPRLSNLLKAGQRAEARHLIHLMAGLLLAISIPITIGVTILAPLLIGWITPDPALYEGVPVLQVLCWAFPLTSLRQLLYLTLLAADHQRFLVATLGVGVGANVGLNLFLIPTYGIVGAAMATIASELFLLIVCGFRYRSRLYKADA